MKMIDVLNKQASGKIKDYTVLKIVDEDENYTLDEYEYYDGAFLDESGNELTDFYRLDTNFLNLEVDLLEGKQ